MAEEIRIITPSETELRQSIEGLKQRQPALGIPRVCQALRQENPTWQLSEKRVRKFMSSMGLIQQTLPAQEDLTTQDLKSTSNQQALIPKSSIPFQDIGQTLGKGMVEVKYIGGTKGKGVFATKDFFKGEKVFEETPFAWYPRWDTVGGNYHTFKSDHECQLCARTIERRGLFGEKNRSLLRPVKCKQCSGWFCSNLCKKEAEAKFHRIECGAHNPHIVELAEKCRNWQWGAPMGAVRALERVIMEFEEGGIEQGKKAWTSLRAFATVRADVMDMKRKGDSWFLYEEDYETKWKTTYDLMKKATCPPSSSSGLTQFEMIPKKIRNEMFSYNEWLNLIGKYSLNDQNGGFYLLQSCFNHNCDSNCVVVHPNDGKYRAIIKTLRPIKQGEEMTITYVNPRDSIAGRKQELRNWYMFDCRCQRCLDEERAS